jgi:hypothetical protein
VELRLQEHLQKVAEIKRTTSKKASGSGGDSMFGSSSGMAAAIDLLPELGRRKRTLDMHTNIATSLLQEIQRRELDGYFSFELDLMTRERVDKKELTKLLGAEGKGTAADKLRLLIIYYFRGANVSDTELDELAAALTKSLEASSSSSSSTVDVAATLAFCKQFKQMNDMSRGAEKKTAQSPKQHSTMSSIFNRLASKVVEHGAGLFQGVKNLLPASKDLPLTKIVDALVNAKDNATHQAYLYYDPKLVNVKGAVPVKQINMAQRAKFKEALVFVLGGGNFVEFQNLQAYADKQAAKHAAKQSGGTLGSMGLGSGGGGASAGSGLQDASAHLTISYGSTEIVSPSEFLASLASLGGSSNKSSSAAAGSFDLD